MNGITMNTNYTPYYPCSGGMIQNHYNDPGKISAFGAIQNGDDSEKAYSANAARGSDKSEKNDAFGVKRKSSPEECQTCKERKYQDGSDENVSFKSASHISPEAAGARVRAHESEHVANAYSDAAKKDGKVIRASVSIHTSICPECGRTFVSGGTTNTMIQYSDESNPYQKNQKSLDAAQFIGRNIDYVA